MYKGKPVLCNISIKAFVIYIFFDIESCQDWGSILKTLLLYTSAYSATQH